MTDEGLTPEQIDAELARVNRLIGARSGKAGYLQNVEVLRKRVTELTAQKEALQMSPTPPQDAN